MDSKSRMAYIDSLRASAGISKVGMARIMGMTYKHYRVLLRGGARLRVEYEERGLSHFGINDFRYG